MLTRPDVIAERRPRPVTTTDWWKLAGLVLVLVDHYGLFFAPDQDWWRVFGRLAAPIFFFFIGFARSRTVPWTWVVLGLILTVLDVWTSKEGLGKVNLNILINFAYIRLLLPVIERRVMPDAWRAALLAVTVILLIRPFQQVMEYGAEGWLWALFGLSHRLALERDDARSRWTRTLLAAAVAVVYVSKEVVDYTFDLGQGLALAVLVAMLAALLARFRRAKTRWQPPALLAALLTFCGRRSLEIYALSLFVMQLSAYALGTDASNDGDEDAG